MTISNPIQLVAQDVCDTDVVCGPQSLEASLACSPIGYVADPLQGWVWKYGIAQVTFWKYCSSTNIYSLSSWLPASITFQLCPLPNAQNQEPNASRWHSNWAYFGGVAAGECTNQYRIKCEFTPISYNEVSTIFTVQALNRVDGKNVWQGYTAWGAICTEIPPRLERYNSRGYAPSAQYTPISTSQVGGKGDVTHVSFTVGVVPWLEYCGDACKLFDGDAFQGCANAVVYSKTDPENTDLTVQSNTNYDITIINANESYLFTNNNITNSVSFITSGGIVCIKISVTNNDLVENVTVDIAGYLTQTVLPTETYTKNIVVNSGTVFTITGPNIASGLVTGSIFKSIDCQTEFTPFAFLMGRNGDPCGTNITQYCYCDQIILTSTSPVEGTSINNEFEGPNKNDFIQQFGYGTGMSGQTVGAVQQFQIGLAQGEYLVMANVNQGPLQFGTYNVANDTWIWGSAQQITNGNPTVYFVDRPDRYYYIYTFRFPNYDILPSCPGTTTTTPEPIPTTTTAYPFPPTTTTTTSTTCQPPMMFNYVDIPPEFNQIMTTPVPNTEARTSNRIEEMRALLKAQKGGGCGCSGRSKS